MAASTSKRAPKGEVAAVARDSTLPSYGGGALPNTDETLRTRGAGKGLALYDELERDAHAFAVLQKRKLAVSSREWEVEPGGESPADIRAADRVRDQLKALKFDRLTVGLMDAALKGYAVGEIIWEVTGGEIVAKEIKPRRQQRFLFDAAAQPRLITREHPKGEELPERKFIVHSYGAKDGSPYGKGLGHILFWPVFFKRKGITFWLTFADKYGSPTGVGKYPNGASQEDKDNLLEALGAIAQETGIIIPEGMTIELLEAKRSGTIETYDKLVRWCDEQISEAVLGETLTTNIGTVGSMAASQTHNEVREELTKADADLLSDTLNDTLVKWITEFNDPAAAPPRVWRIFEEPVDRKNMAETDEILERTGWVRTEESFIETYGDGYERRTPAPPEPVKPNAPAPAFADPPPDAADNFAETGIEAAGEIMDGLLEPVRNLVEHAESLEAIRDGLIGLYPNMDEAAFGDLMQRALAAGELAGRGLGWEGVPIGFHSG